MNFGFSLLFLKISVWNISRHFMWLGTIGFEIFNILNPLRIEEDGRFYLRMLFWSIIFGKRCAITFYIYRRQESFQFYQVHCNDCFANFFEQFLFINKELLKENKNYKYEKKIFKIKFLFENFNFVPFGNEWSKIVSLI